MTTNLNQNRHNAPQWKNMVVLSSFPENLQGLNDLASNLWWTWNYEVKDLFQEIDEKLWATTLNPIDVLKEISIARLQELEKNQGFMARYHAILEKFNKYIAEEPDATKARIGYFSMEYGLDDSLKIFSGGLGILAGDYLKEASDTNTNMAAVGFLYKYGYFQQQLSLDGEQMAIYTPQSPSQLPIHLVKDAKGNNITVQVGLPGRILNAQIWLVHVGRIKLYLLDTDIAENSDEDKTITHALYGGNNENRLKQEMLLGIGGVRCLEAVGEKIDIFHCNEGHAAFINLERLRKLIKHENFPFPKALEIVRSSTLYTTHTPVPAGHDSFPEDLMMTYLGQFPERLQLQWNEFMNLGRMYANNQGEPFSMSNLAICTSQEVNGVSRLHGEVSKDMFKDLWPGYDVSESYIGYVTNGVHYGTWTAKEWQKVYASTFGKGFLEHQSEKNYWSKIYGVADEKIWDIRQAQREKLINFVKDRLIKTWTERFEDPKKLLKIIQSVNKNTLTIGFARRFATYKRAYLLFSNLDRLSAIVNNPERPVQFIFAGKAHPNDKPGQDIIKEIVRISKLPEFLGKIIFLENYDMNLAKKLVQGVDIWLNTPTRPLEASGTSGMKAVMNGAMNFSVLDGWWCEGYKEGAGWALPEKRTYTNQDFQNRLDAETIYSILENEIVPLYYDKGIDNVPHKWIQYVKKCIAEIAPEFTTKRMIDDYHSRFYSKLEKRKRMMFDNNYALAEEIYQWKKHVSETWDSIYVALNELKATDSLVLGQTYKATIKVDLKGLKTEDVRFDFIITETNKEGKEEIISCETYKFVKMEDNLAVYELEVSPKQSGIFNYSVRMYPYADFLPYRQDFPYVKWL
ncbi:MAG: alpha-glucan family phosphorylase [Bacteroidales bacterium]|jgi:alpha-glucan phosphorylase-like protein|nr:alpha-glucan family phosphorylase [Bacteroidales bacterium]